MFRFNCVQVPTSNQPRREWTEGDYQSLPDASAVAREIGKPTVFAHVYDEHAAVLFTAGGGNPPVQTDRR